MGVNGVIQNYGNDMHEKAVRICRAYLPGAWKKITAADVEVNRISGGLSNWLYLVRLRKTINNSVEVPKEILLRLYGQSHGECGVQHLISESVIFALLSERKLGPRLHGVFAGGRIEEYVPARPLRLSEMKIPKISSLIVEKMVALHSLSLPLSREPTWLWETCKRWLNEIGDINALEHKNCKLRTLLKTDLYNEVKWLRNHFGKFSCPIVFCHNDMQEGNILLKTDVIPSDSTIMSDSQCEQLDASSLIIIDYEYCAYNYRSYEIANHFMEWIFDYKVSEHPYFSVYPEQYPTLKQQKDLVEHYLTLVGSDESVDDVVEEIANFTLGSHLLWSIWGLLNGKTSKITFGYWEYAAERLQMYYTLKSQLLQTNGNTPLTMPRVIRPH